MLECLTSEQITEWQAFNQLEPIGSQRQDFYNANLISWIVNIARSIVPRKRGEARPKMSPPAEFMPVWYEDEDILKVEPKKQPLQEMKTILLGLAKDREGRIQRRKRKLPIVNKKKLEQKKQKRNR